MHKLIPAVAVALAFGLSACGTTDLERGASGAAIGAGLASLTGHDPVVGLALGASAGVLCDNVAPELCRR